MKQSCSEILSITELDLKFLIFIFKNWAISTKTHGNTNNMDVIYGLSHLTNAEDYSTFGMR